MNTPIPGGQVLNHSRRRSLIRQAVRRRQFMDGQSRMRRRTRGGGQTPKALGRRLNRVRWWQ